MRISLVVKSGNIVSRGKMEHGGKMGHRVFEKSMPGVGLFSCPLNFCHRPVLRHSSKSNLQ